MSATVWLAANTVGYLEGGGHFWAYLNWALGLRTLGCRVIWLEEIPPSISSDRLDTLVSELRERLAPYGLDESIALYGLSSNGVWSDLPGRCLDLRTASDADLLLNLQYGMHPDVVRLFRRAALIDIDPGLLQIWMAQGTIRVAPHTAYFSIGETVGKPLAQFTDAGITWEHTTPCVALDWWPASPAPGDAAFSTVSHWYEDEWVDEDGEAYRNDKQTGFLPYVDLPRLTGCRMELALCLADDEGEDRAMLEEHGWTVRHAYDISSTPWEYQQYVQRSRGEFSCAKPSYVRMDTAWISDRTVCYLASGKPAVVQYTGSSQFLPSGDGLHRFRDPAEAASALKEVVADYDRQSRAARSLAEEYFDARRVVGRLLERALA